MLFEYAVRTFAGDEDQCRVMGAAQLVAGIQSAEEEVASRVTHVLNNISEP